MSDTQNDGEIIGYLPGGIEVRTAHGADGKFISGSGGGSKATKVLGGYKLPAKGILTGGTSPGHQLKDHPISKHAIALTIAANHGNTREPHANAAKAHKEAAAKHSAAGHEDAAHYHNLMAASHGKKARPSSLHKVAEKLISAIDNHK